MSAIYYEQRYCDGCMIVHWLEVTGSDREICHGSHYHPHSDSAHYMRRSGKGFEVIEKQHAGKPLPVEWEFAIDVRKDPDF